MLVDMQMIQPSLFDNSNPYGERRGIHCLLTLIPKLDSTKEARERVDIDLPSDSDRKSIHKELLLPLWKGVYYSRI